jgi:hypothetical protein
MHTGRRYGLQLCSLVCLASLPVSICTPRDQNICSYDSSPTVLHVGQAIYYKVWWMFPTAVLAGFGEILGWAGRVWSSKNLVSDDPFMMS